jgi:glycosyltransferase involved in cell wall biosynthesis
MKVLLVSPYSEKSVGGIINWTKFIVNYHREHNDGIELRLLNNENARQIVDGANPLRRLVAGLGNYLPILREFKRILSERHYDVAHISSSASLGLIRDLLLVKAARRKGVRTCVHMHFGRIPQILQSGGWEDWLMRSLFNAADKVLVMDRASYTSLKGGNTRDAGC